MSVYGHCFENDLLHRLSITDAYRRIDHGSRETTKAANLDPSSLRHGKTYSSIWRNTTTLRTVLVPLRSRYKIASPISKTRVDRSSSTANFRLLTDLDRNNSANTVQLLAKINDELANALVPILPKLTGSRANSVNGSPTSLTSTKVSKQTTHVDSSRIVTGGRGQASRE